MKSAPPMAPPGCPDLAFSTMAAASILMLSAALLIVFSSIRNDHSLFLTVIGIFTMFAAEVFIKNIPRNRAFGTQLFRN